MGFSRKTTLIHSFLIFILFLSFIISTASAVSHSDFGKAQAEKARKIKSSITDDLLHIESEGGESGSSQADKFEFKISLHQNKGLEIKEEYTSNSITGEISSEFKININTMLEFNDTDQNSAYDHLTDSILQQIEIKDLSIVDQSSETLENGTILTYYLSDESGIFQPIIKITDSAMFLDDNSLLPTQLKIDFRFMDFPFTFNQSMLAVGISVEKTYVVDEIDETEDEKNNISTNEEGIQTNNPEYPAYFTWMNNIHVDGANLTTFSSKYFPDEDEQSEFRLFFAYPQGNEIVHDPKLGVANTFFFSAGDTFNLASLPFWAWILLISALIGITGFILYMSVPQFREYLLTRYLPLSTAPHRLTMEEVLENEIRMELITEIIENPGIHYSELLRRIDTSPANLAWHFDILETYKVVKKQRLGNYLIFYPYLDKNPFANLDPTIAKSKTTLEILQIIGDNPGIYQGKIAKRLDLNRKSVQYHLDKLEQLGLIHRERKGRKTHLFQVLKQPDSST